jgi:HD domain
MSKRNLQTCKNLATDQGRRYFLLGVVNGATVCVGAPMLALSAEQISFALPKEVGGIRLPDTLLAQAAVDLARAASPAFLFNHCMRTYLFGAMLAEVNKVSYDQEMVFVAAALHDLGLTSLYATPDHAFEVDGANAAKEFLTSRGVTEARAELVWNAIALHTSALVDHQAPQVGLVGSGAGADVFASQLGLLRRERIHAVVKSFPRGSFNTEFRDLLVAHCQRKPFSQRGTWLDGFCRAHNPGLAYPDLETRLLSTHFPE